MKKPARQPQLLCHKTRLFAVTTAPFSNDNDVVKVTMDQVEEEHARRLKEFNRVDRLAKQIREMLEVGDKHCRLQSL